MGEGTLMFSGTASFKMALPQRNLNSRVEVEPGTWLSDEDLCECGHMTNMHRNNGVAVCETVGCGCYTFRQTLVPVAKAPLCAVCDRQIIATRVILVDGRFKVQRWHDTETNCETVGIAVKTYEPVYDPDDKAWVESSGERPTTVPIPKCPACGEIFTGKRVNPGRNNSVIYFHSDERGNYTCQVDELYGRIIKQTERRPALNDWAFEVEKARADRNKPQRAPRETGEDFV